MPSRGSDLTGQGAEILFDTYVRRGIVVRHIDGDTIAVDWDLGDKIWKHSEAMRLVNVFAPELHEPGGPEAAAALSAFLPEATEVSIQTFRVLSGGYRKSFERYVAQIWRTSDGLDINQAMRVVIGTPSGSGT